MSETIHFKEPDAEIIAKAFPCKAWAYAVSYHNVQIGLWEDGILEFRDGYNPLYLTELRVFNATRELRWIRSGKGFLFRDTEDEEYSGAVAYIKDLVMYGEKADCDGDGTGTILSEDRGCRYFFPKRLSFQKALGESNEDLVELRLRTRDFSRYNEIVVCKKGDAYDSGLRQDGRGAFEIFDYAFAGFFIGGAEIMEVGL